jgi:hypothetical protein
MVTQHLGEMFGAHLTASVQNARCYDGEVFGKELRAIRVEEVVESAESKGSNDRNGNGSKDMFHFALPFFRSCMPRDHKHADRAG